MVPFQAGDDPSVLRCLLQETPLIVGAVSTIVLFTIGEAWTADPSALVRSALLFAWIFAVMLWCSFAVVRHADHLAHALGERTARLS